PHVCPKFVASPCEAVSKVLDITVLVDVVVHIYQVTGVVVNWTAFSTLTHQIAWVDAVSVESKVVIEATGPEAAV
ncbi:ribose 1,5-bisphosphate isomerase, partial [Thermus scotoductus]